MPESQLSVFYHTSPQKTAHVDAAQWAFAARERMAVNGFGERIERMRRAAYPLNLSL